MVHLIAPVEEPLDPIDALRRGAFLMERTRAGSYRVEAFRKAVKTLKALAPGELDRQVDAGTLQEIPGIGKSTAGVIEAAARGETAAYLSGLEEKSGGPLAEGGEELYAALQGDCHLHSDWSDGGSPIDEMVLTGLETGHSWMVLTDHSPQLRVANGLTAERLAQQIAIVEAIDRGVGEGFSFFKGIEVDILDDGSLDQSPEMLSRLDLVTASVHSKLRMNASPMTKRMVAAVRNPRVNVLGTAPVGSSRAREERATVGLRRQGGLRSLRRERHGGGDQQSSRAVRPPDELIGLALDAGCLFAIDSDAHAPGQLDMKAYGAARATRLGVPPDRIITTWDADRLRAWARPA